MKTQMMKRTVLPFMMLLLLASCNQKPEQSGCIQADIRGELGKASTLGLADEITGVNYVPLEMTKDEASLIDGVTTFVVTSRYIYVVPVKEMRVVQFDRKGHFIKNLIKFGQGPGEVNDAISNMQADEKNDRLYLFGAGQILVYTTEGKFLQKIAHKYQSVFESKVGEDRYAAVSFPYVPFDSGFGLGIFSSKGDTLLTKKDFYSPVVPHEKSGFTACLAVTYCDCQNSILFKTGSNDTIYRISKDAIDPVCALNLKNSEKEVKRSLDITDFSVLQGNQGEDKDIFVSDLFETPKCFYFRFRYNQGHCVASVDKNTGATLVEKCEQAADLKEMAKANLLHGMTGTRSFKGFPIWGRMAGDELVQVITPYELSLYRENNKITIPSELQKLPEEGNPVFIFYQIKK